MPKIAPELSPAAIRRLMDRPGKHAVGGVAGVLLQVTVSKTTEQLRRSWLLRTVWGDKRIDIGLGSYPTVTVGMARDRARKKLDEIVAGKDPREERRQRRAALIAEQAAKKSFRKCAEGYIEAHQASWKNLKHPEQWRNTLRDYAYPVIGDLAWNEIETPHVLQVLEPIWTQRTETASRVRGRIENVLDWARVRYGNGDDRANPARWKGHLDKMLPGKTNVAPVEHHEALPHADIPVFMADLRARNGIAARCLEFTLLTWARSGAARGARWAEIDWQQARTWTIPAERNKGRRGSGKPHTVPLSDPAIELLKLLPQTSDLVFPAPKGGELSDMALTAVLRRMKVPAVPHGFRSSAKDWASETTSHPDIVSEMALAHTISEQVIKAYRRGDLLNKRRKLMADWGRYCTTAAIKEERGKVLTFRNA
ncbi:MAG: tyrosine-type recombinase/integrase [Geminicoccaceae bacterium]